MWLPLASLLALFAPVCMAVQCTPAVYGSDGSIDFTRTLLNCSAHMSDPELIYSYKETVEEPVSVYTQLSLNNLISISDLESTMSVDLFFVLSWVDPRWNITALWAGQKEALAYQGIAIEQLVFTEDETRLRIWMPDITFTDEIGGVVVAQTLKIRPGGLFMWARHLRLDIVQPHFTYENYPRDKQSLNIRFMSNAYSIDFLRLKYSLEPINFVNSAYPNLNDVNWELSSQWYLDSTQFETKIWEDQREYSSGSVTISSTFDSAILILDAERISDGLLIRLGVPILILMVLSGLVFWAATENRIDATMTILLAVSALYIVVFGNIPMLGYLTSFDTYVISMFFLLTCAVAIHQLNYRISEKADRRPLRYVIVRFLEFIGRVAIFPLAIIMFLVMFPSEFVLRVRTPMLVVLSLLIVFISIRDIGGVRKTFLNTMDYYAERRDRGEMHSMSEFELKFFFFYEKNLKKYFGGSKKKDDDDDDDEAEYVPRMPNPNQKHGPTSIYVANTRKNAAPKLPDGDFASGSSSPSVGNNPVAEVRDSLSTGAMEMSQFKKPIVPPSQTGPTGTSSSVEALKRTSKKSLKKQSIIDDIMNAEKMRVAKRATAPATSIDEEVGHTNPMLSKK